MALLGASRRCVHSYPGDDTAIDLDADDFTWSLQTPPAESAPAAAGKSPKQGGNES